MQDNTVSNMTLFDGTTDKTEELNAAVLKLFSEGDVVPVTMNDEEFSARLDVPAGEFSMAFEDEGYYPEALCSKCDLPAGHIKACE